MSISLVACAETNCSSKLFFSNGDSVYGYDVKSNDVFLVKKFSQKNAIVHGLTVYKDKIICEVSGVLYSIDVNGDNKNKITEGRKPVYIEEQNLLFYYSNSGEVDALYSLNLSTDEPPIVIESYDSKNNHISDVQRLLRKIVNKKNSEIAFTNSDGYLTIYNTITGGRKIYNNEALIPIYYDSSRGIVCLNMEGTYLILDDSFNVTSKLSGLEGVQLLSFSHKCNLALGSAFESSLGGSEKISLIAYNADTYTKEFTVDTVFTRDAIWAH
jgi:hypothetical protein